MPKRKGSRKKDSFPWGSMTPKGYLSRVATDPPDGRKTNPTKILRRKYG